MICNCFIVQKRAFRAITFFNTVIDNSKLLTLGSQFAFEYAKWNADKVLIVLLAYVYALLNVLKVTYDDVSNIAFKTVAGNNFYRSIHKVIESVCSFLGQFDKALGIYISLLMFINALQARFLFVIPMVNRFQLFTTQDKRGPIGRIKARCKIIYTAINRKIFILVKLFRWLNLLFVYKFDIEFFSIKIRNNAKLLKLRCRNIFRKFKFQGGRCWFVNFLEFGSQANKNIPVFDSSGTTANSEHSVFFSLILWWSNLLRIFASVFQLEQGKKRLKVSFDQSKGLLSNICKQHFVVVAGFANMIVFAIIQIVVVVEEILTNIVKPLVVEPGRKERQPPDCFHLIVISDKSILLC